MLRMAHRILSTRELSFSDDYGPDRWSFVQDFFQSTKIALQAKIPVIIADNVAENYNESVRLREVPRFDDIPPCPPPFPIFMIEWNWPDPMYECVDGVMHSWGHKDTNVLQSGMLVCSREDGIHESWAAKAIVEVKGELGRAILHDTKFAMEGLLFSTVANGIIVLSHRFCIFLDANGRWLHHIGDKYLEGEVSGAPFYIGGLTLAFMQIRNVERVDVTKTDGPSPKWCRRQRVPELKYQILLIDPDRSTQKRGERKTTGDRSGKRRHIRRGCFKNYVDDGVSKGFMGKLIYGWMWVASHEVGSSKDGEIISEYRVKAPKTESGKESLE